MIRNSKRDSFQNHFWANFNNVRYGDTMNSMFAGFAHALVSEKVEIGMAPSITESIEIV